MGMDALTSTAFDSLVKDVLPKLAKKLAEAGKTPAAKREPPAELGGLLKEAFDLLQLLGGWADPALFGGADVAGGEMSDEDALAMMAGGDAMGAGDGMSGNGDMSDDDAMAMLAAEGVDSIDAADVRVNTHKSVADALNDDEDGEVDPAALLAGMGAKPQLAPKALAKPAAPAADDDDAAMMAMMAGGGAGGEMSDADAMAMMAGGGADGEMSDADAMAMMAGGGDGEMSDADAMAMMAGGGAEAPVAGGEMSDDEARRLLEEMDAPVAAAPAPKAAAKAPAAKTAAKPAAKAPAAKAPAAKAVAEAADGEMSDDEARALLAMMDGPAPVAPAPAGDDAASADDEAMAMLAAMGGAEDAPAAPAARAAAPSPYVPHAVEGEEALDEIPETSDNEFANDPDMMTDFVTNTDDLMETLDNTILQLEQNPKDRETIESIFRAAHTLKGAAGMFGFKAIERVMHRMENLFDQVRKGVLVPDSNIIDLVFKGLDVLRALLAGIKAGKPSGVKTVAIVRALEAGSKGQYVKGSVGSTDGGGAAPAGGGDHGGGGDDEERAGAKSGGPKKKKEEVSTIRVDLERLDHLVNLVGELVIDRTRFASIEEDIRTTQPQLPVASNMSETVQLFGRHMNEIHEIIMKIRMVPIGNAFNKFTRIVRDLSRQLDKEIELYIDGEDTELDKTLVEQIGDPLIHLIRNSCDHGVETPAVRTAAGKNSQGKIFLSARQEGNNIIITIEDDGKGINVEAIRKKGIERGLVAEDAVMSERDIINLIFEPGFSTAEKVTTVSGRGVGMDVVRKQISKLKGLIDIDTKLGKGTTTTIRLPLTLAIVQSLLIESQGECFAIPLSTVVESVRIKPEEIQRVGDAEVIKRHGKVLPLLHLHDNLELSRKKDVSWYSGHHRTAEANQATTNRINKRKDRLYVVIVGSGDRRFGIIVDQLLHQQEMVIKSLGPVMKNTPCVAGGAVLGNGEVVLVLDIQELEDSFRSKARVQQAA